MSLEICPDFLEEKFKKLWVISLEACHFLRGVAGAASFASKRKRGSQIHNQINNHAI